MTMEMFGRWVFAAIIKYVNILHSVHARSLTPPRLHAHIAYNVYSHVHVHRTVSCIAPDTIAYASIAPDTIAYAKVSGADSSALRTQLHLIPASKIKINKTCLV